ncbi:ABC transporter ATP-binding protein [Proteiniborus sp. MB09-C3]|uniref:ATP-binding cassette domain-containing protein n=1 Tax=Proteiniborus sp. MB09-C3 TaxID=3050072 RepID=UPI002557503B|nr:ABC transporter ATP-binding protein [Proteiniborus sp. MB09-C3]WIV10382.1 ABC transporter ATP-binding protein [Proteiniborus sp. MB09-C3]
MKRIYYIFRKSFDFYENYKMKFLLSNILILFILLIVTIEPYILAQLITALYSFNQNKFYTFLGIIILLNLSKYIINYTKERLDILIKKKVAISIKYKLMQNILESHPNTLCDFTEGKLLTIMYNDSLVVRDFVYIISAYFKDFITIAIIGIIMLRINIFLSFIVILLFPLIAYVNKQFGNKINQESREILKKTDSIMEMIKKNIMSINDIKYSNSMKKILAFFQDKINELNKKTIHCEKTKLNNLYLSNILGLCGNIIFLLVGGSLIFNKTVEVGNFIAFLTYSKYFSTSLFSITTMYGNLQQQIVSAERIIDLYSRTKCDIDNREDMMVTNDDMCININDVSLAFGEKVILKNIDLEIEKNQKVCILGKNGSGKTSLLNLLSGIYQISSGSITINDTDIKHIEFKDLVKNITYARQIPYVYNNSSIRENILLSDEGKNISEDRLREICEDFHIIDDIMNMPDGFDTVITENYKLSSGQMKKIQLIRCFLRNTPILLLDEPLSNVDREFIKSFPKIIDKYCENKIVIISTHNLNCYDKFDKIVNLSHFNRYDKLVGY